MKTFPLIVAFVALAMSLAGCSSDDKTSGAEDQKIKDQLTQKFDINKVPEDKRAMVQGMIDAQNKDRAKHGLPPIGK